jgi:hypothetical protein
MTDDERPPADFGRRLYDRIVEQNRRKDAADLESWYYEYHHWNHYSAVDRSSAG